MREKDIRPQSRIDYNRNVLYPRDLKKFFRKWKDKFILFKKCLICGHDKIITVTIKDGFRFQKCKKCGFVFINPRPSFRALCDWYQNSEHMKDESKLFEETEKKRLPLFKKRLKVIMREALKRIRRKKDRKMSIVELGAGVGSMIKMLDNALGGKHDLLGVELDSYACGIAKKKGLRMYSGAFEDFVRANKKSHDLVYCFELIEHLFFFFFFIKSLNSMVGPGGFIYMTTPNYYGYDFLTLGKKYKNLFGPDHLNYFNKKSIEILLNRYDFELVYYRAGGILDVDIVKNYFERNEANVDNFWKYIFESTKTHKDFLRDFQRLLIKHDLSGHSEFLAVRKQRIK